MSKFFTRALHDLLSLKKMTIDQYFEELNAVQRKSFVQHHKDVIRSKANMRHFTDDRIHLLMPFIEENPEEFTSMLVSRQLKIGIQTKPSTNWSVSTRPRQLKPFHYKYPELTIFKSGADVKAWFASAPELVSYTSLKYMLTEVVPYHAKYPSSAFGHCVRGMLVARFIPLLTERDFDVLYSDGDTLLNELFNEDKFKECVANGFFPDAEFVQVLELNCTLSALEKDRSSRHSKTVAKNLKRARLLLEIKNNNQS
jgi:hypothetical protein